MSVKNHYDSHLGNFYEWMVGDFDEKQKEQEAYFRSQSISADAKGLAIDLGAGHGLQSISLAKLGFQLKAVDFNQQLLESLRRRASRYDIELISSGILAYMSNCPKADLIVCMGDTLAHLDSFLELEELIRLIYTKLKPGASFISSFRDYQVELTGAQRFIPVKSDENRIHTCFLEYQTNTVSVTDILHEKTETGWEQKVSTYEKLRLEVEKVQDLMLKVGFKLDSLTESKRMNYLHVRK